MGVFVNQFYTYFHSKPGELNINNIFYVGKGTGRRAYELGVSYSRNQHHKNTVSKYGKENILVSKIECSSEQIALDLEKGLIKLLRRQGVKLVNQTEGGDGSPGFSRPHTDKEKEKLKLAALGNKHALGNKLSTETREKMRVRQLGISRKHSEQTKLKLSAAHSGKTLTEQHKTKISEFYKNISQEEKIQRAKIRRQVSTGLKMIEKDGIRKFLKPEQEMPEGWGYIVKYSRNKK
jgi:hypothetical protein